MFRWALLGLRTCYSNNVLYIWALTNRPTHNILRWTDTVPRLSKTWPKRRGIPHEMRDRFITAEWRSIEQNEPGLTMTKTFTWPSWPPLENRWFLLTHRWGKYIEASQSPLYIYQSPADPAYTHVFTELFSSW